MITDHDLDHCGDAAVELDATARDGLRWLSWGIAVLGALALCASLALLWAEHVNQRRPVPECAVPVPATEIKSSEVRT